MAYLLVLLHPPEQWDIVGLGVSPQGVQQEDRVLEPHLQQAPAGVVHEEGVPVVDGIPQLEGEHGVGAPADEFLAELSRRKTIMVEAVVVLDRLYDLEVSSEEPVSGIGYGFPHVG